MLLTVLNRSSSIPARQWLIKQSNSNLALPIDIFESYFDDALNWLPRHFVDDKLTLVQVMA